MLAVEQHETLARAAREPAAGGDERMLAAGDALHARHAGRSYSDVLCYLQGRAMKARLIKRFEDEIVQLDRELTQDLPKEIKRARELGDLRENAEYHAAKERQRFVEARVSMLRHRVSEIQLMNLDRIPRDKAGFGSKLTIRENGREFAYELVMPEDADPDRGL